MTTDQIIVVIVAVLGIAGVYWFFLGKRAPATGNEEHESMEHHHM
jgi:uncharacterized membrane protein YuzA (DUF378 family)